jgi:hypothetical protein
VNLLNKMPMHFHVALTVRADPSQKAFQLSKGLLDGIELSAVGRREEKLCANRLDHLPDDFAFVTIYPPRNCFIRSVAFPPSMSKTTMSSGLWFGCKTCST